MNKISVIVPAYNLENDLPNCLQSIISQTYKNLEIIVVDDGSIDNTLGVIKQFSSIDNRIKFISKMNSGVTLARLEGLKNATGDWIGFVDGDDVIEPNMYECLLNNAIQHNADISHCGYKLVFPNGDHRYFYNTKQLFVQDNKKGVIDLLEGKFVEPGLWNKLYKKEIMSALNDESFDTSIKYTEDLLMNYFLFSKSQKSVYYDFCPYHYLVRYSSATRSSGHAKKFDDLIRVHEIIYQNSPRDIEPLAAKGLIICYINVLTDMLQTPGFTTSSNEYIKYSKALKNNRFNFKLLDKKHKIMANFILHAPCVYRQLYKSYKKHFSKNPFEQR